MSAQTIHNAHAPILAAHKARVMTVTWGHLAPKRNKTYQGRIVYAVGLFGDDPLNPIALSCKFDGLDNSTWFFDAMTEFLGGQNSDVGYVYEFIGTFRNYKHASWAFPKLSRVQQRRRLAALPGRQT